MILGRFQKNARLDLLHLLMYDPPSAPNGSNLSVYSGSTGQLLSSGTPKGIKDPSSYQSSLTNRPERSRPVIVPDLGTVSDCQLSESSECCFC